MSAFLALALVKRGSRYACSKPRYGTDIRLAVLSGKFVRWVAREKVVRAKNQGDKRSHFHVNNSWLVLPFLLFLMLHEDRFCGFVLVTRRAHMRNTYIEECCFSW